MKVVYILSLAYLIISFLCYKKNDKKISIITSIIYAICLLFCYNTVVVSIYSFLNINGSLLVLSIINYFIGSILNFISYRKKEIQNYYLDKRELITTLIIIGLVFLLALFRFRGFTTLTYETGDPAVHYRTAVHFSRELEILNSNNSKDIIFGAFERIMPISYINCGLLMNIISIDLTYQVFVLFDVFCLVISSLVFFTTIFHILENKKYIYSLILTIIYLLAFPLNNLIFGFSYLGIGVMVINLLFLTIFKEKKFREHLAFKLIILFMINFSIFFSYYLFMPCIYLTLGLYYIYLWKKKNMTFSNLMVYGIITLIVPFIIGLIYFILPGFITNKGIDIITAVNLDGYIYNSKTSRYLLLMLLIIFCIRCLKKQEKFNYFNLSFINTSIYVLLFYGLYKLDYVSLYYFYKLFYLYWFFGIIFIGIFLYKRKEYFYTIAMFIFMGMVVSYLLPNNVFSNFLIKNNIYSWNASSFIEDKILYTKNELELMNKSIEYEDVCNIKNEFLISGDRLKNVWFYSFTGNVPLYGYQYGKATHLDNLNIKLNYWKSLDEYKCLIYFDEDNKKEYDEDDYDILYSNKEGAILKKKDK